MTKEERLENDKDRQTLLDGVENYKKRLGALISDCTEESFVPAKVEKKRKNSFLNKLGKALGL